MICFTICFHRLCSLFMVRFTSESALFSSLCACIIFFFFFVVYFKSNCPVSVSRMWVGVPVGVLGLFLLLCCGFLELIFFFFAEVPAFGSVCYYCHYYGIKQLPDGLHF